MYDLVKDARYIVTSPDEVVVKGSVLEGFTLLISDESKRGLAATIVGEASGGVSFEALYGKVTETVEINEGELKELLNHMVESGAIVQTEYPLSDSAWIAFARFGTLPEKVRPLILLGSGPVRDGIAQKLSQLGISTKTVQNFEELDLSEVLPASSQKSEENVQACIPRTPSPLIVIGEAGSRARLYEINEAAVTAGVPYLLLTASGVEGCIGPYIVPGASACFWEYERQWMMTSPSEAYAEMFEAYESEQKQREPLYSPVGLDFITALGVPWLCELAIRGVSSLAGEVVRGRATNGFTQRHRIMRLPRCPVCMKKAPLTRNPLY